MTVTLQQLQEGLTPLQELCVGEYHIALNDVLFGDGDELAFKRLGRLMCVWLKEPFAQSFPYDPDIPTNWARSLRCWEIHGPVPSDVIATHAPQREILELFAAEWTRPVEFLAEFNLFHSMCKRLRPLVCDDWKALDNAEKIAKELRKEGQDVQLLTKNQIIGAASVGLATYLVQNLPWLSTDHMPLVAGTTLLGVCMGQRKLCQLLTDFVNSNDESKDRFANVDFPHCGSTDTNDGKPCGNRVREHGLLCWIHA